MEEVFSTLTGGAIWGVGFGLALTAVRGAGGGLRPLAKNAIKGAVMVSDWVQSATAEGRETVEDLYHEAQADRRNETRRPARPRQSRSRSRRKENGAEA
jgi:hypothetical protein